MSDYKSLTSIILTYNEEVHLEDALKSLIEISDRIIVVDSGSTDKTEAIAQKFGAEFFRHPFENQARQFNWALDNIEIDTEWVFRLDADEIINRDLEVSLESLKSKATNHNAFWVDRYMCFQGHRIRWGGVFPIRVVRLFRNGFARYPDTWMDEHLIVNGSVGSIDGYILDDNKMSFSDWIKKHDQYSDREVLELCKKIDRDDQRFEMPFLSNQWLKTQIYYRLPSSLRSFAYFCYRYVLRLGFLDGFWGFAFHFMQGFWYRLCVDIKFRQVQDVSRSKSIKLIEAAEQVLGSSKRLDFEAGELKKSKLERV